MACRDIRVSKILLRLGLFMFATSLCHCATLTRLKALDASGGDSVHSQNQTRSNQHHGRLLIGQNPLKAAKLNETKDVLGVESDYQADMAWGDLSRQGFGPNQDHTAVQQLLKMEPKVECTGDSMKLLVQDAASTSGSLFFVDRGRYLAPLPLSKLPPSCGYTIRSTRRDLVLVAPYDGCFVTVEEGSYVLPLRWWGLPVRMTCPLMKQSLTNPPMVTCHTEGMVVKTEWTIAASKMKVNLNGDWELLMKASQRCGFGIVVHPEGVVISVQYAPCLEKKDGFYTLGLSGLGETQISCPSLLVTQSEPPQNPATVLIQQTTQTPNPAKVTVPQFSSFNQNPKNPNPGPKDIHQPPLPYYPMYPSFFYHYPPSLDITSTVQSPNPSTSPLVKQTTKDQRPHYFVPLYPQPSTPQPTPTQPPVAKPPPGKLDDQFFQNPFNIPTMQPQKPVGQPASQPKGPEQGPLYPFIFHLQPPQPQASEAPRGETPSYTLYSETLSKKPGLQQPTVPVKPQEHTVAPQPEAPQGPMYQPFYHYSYYSQSQPASNPTAAPQSPHPEAPQDSVYQPFFYYPYYPQPKPGHPPASKPTTASQSPHPEASQDSVYQPFFYYPYYPQPKPGNPPASKTPAASQSPKAEAPQGQVDQPTYFHPQPKPEYQPVKNPTVAPQPATQTPTGQGLKPYPATQIPGTSNDKAPVEKPIQSNDPQQGQMHQPFTLFYYPQQPVLLPPYISMQHQVATLAGDQKFTGSAIPQTGNFDIVQQGAQLGSLYMQPYCSQFCPLGLSNCCPQIVFHQHLHIVPTGHGSKEAPRWYQGLPFLPSAAYPEFGNGLSSAPPPPQKPTEAPATQAATFTSPPSSPQSLPLKNIKQPYSPPPDGNPAALPGSNPSMVANPNLQVYPYFAPNPLYPHQPNPPEIEMLQSFPQGKPPPPSYENSKASGKEPANPVVEYEPYIQSPTKQNSQLMSAGNVNKHTGPYIGKYQQYYRLKQHNQPKATDWLPYYKKFSDSKGSAHINIHRDRFRVPYSMLQDASAPAYNRSALPNNSQPQMFAAMSDPNNSTKQEQAPNPNSEQKGYVLLQHGPPGKDLNSFTDSLMPFRDLLYGAYSIAQEPASEQSSKPQNPLSFELPQENTQHPKWPEEGMPDPLLGHIDYEQRFGHESDWPSLPPAPDGLRFVFMPHEPSVNAAHLNPKYPQSFEDPWKLLTPLGSIQRFPPDALGNPFQHQSSAADHQRNGVKHSLPTEHENQKQK